ncbi:MAG TPA: nucleotidyltransferase domain-containing protein [Stellaceae bacterium]|nr:nucleotidyltransferase domain-containing protein [Stellaceae bacterium]
MMGWPAEMRYALRAWAQRCHSIRRLYVFGSRAKGTGTCNSDLDLAVILEKTHGNQLSELIVNRASWQCELTSILGIVVKDIYLADDPGSIAYAAVCDHGILIFDRDSLQK